MFLGHDDFDAAAIVIYSMLCSSPRMKTARPLATRLKPRSAQRPPPRSVLVCGGGIMAASSPEIG